jgi:hypothetical protein
MGARAGFHSISQPAARLLESSKANPVVQPHSE